VPSHRYAISLKGCLGPGRETTRVEDKAYSLLGPFGVNMPMVYGEKENVFVRLQEEVLKITEDYSIFAWHNHDADRESSFTSIYRDVLAYSPANFCRLACQKCTEPRTWDYSDLECVLHDASSDSQLTDNLQWDLPSLSVRGLRLNLPRRFAEASDTNALVYLHCRVGPSRERLCLRLSPYNVRRDQFRKVGLECIPDPKYTGFKLTVVYIGSYFQNGGGKITNHSILGIIYAILLLITYWLMITYLRSKSNRRNSRKSSEQPDSPIENSYRIGHWGI